ncbi:two-component sensor histidine kinase [Pararhizobium capsulatum DSM 1112]|uniref:histidine kinase n=1 Tax=Pararhizobium capsulatum DSM 1112 TaxID=1121113 RepID=A0ABU0BS83_9HYPH|nr:HWE histidine kinase domain-containing protein [Pararhizobium capsulatum]MDQ0321121.1 two-component sensor histidine kinase [Pararhizobium capsulatum DSM 1112]
MRSSLAKRLFVLMLMCIVPLAAILFYNLYALWQSQERSVHDEAYRLGQVASLEMARIMGGVEDTLLAVAAAPIVRDFQADACNAYMARVTKALPQFSGIAVLDGSGVIRCLQNPAGIGVSLADKAYFQDSMRTGATVIGRFTEGRVSKELVLPVAVPIRDEAGKVLGVVAGSISLKWLEQKLTERNFAKSSSLTVADADGTIIARYPEPERFVGTQIPERYRHLVRAVAPGTTELTSQDGTHRILAYFPPSSPSTGLYVSVGLSTAEEYGEITKALVSGIVVTLGATIVACLLAWITGRYAIRRPVDRLVSTVEAWRHDQPGARTGLSEADGEFGVVGKAIDDFMDELADARGRSEILMRELDHRVKNLLATVQVVARQSLKSANIDAKVLRALDARLAAMSDAHSVLMGNEKQKAKFVEIVRSAIHPFDKPEATAFEISGPDVVLGSKAALAFSMALHELCTNAAKYGALSAEGKVWIKWDVRRVEDADMLIFHWREIDGPTVSTPTSEGFGGLMIRRMLPDQLRGTLSITYAVSGLDLRFEVPVGNLAI